MIFNLHVYGYYIKYQILQISVVLVILDQQREWHITNNIVSWKLFLLVFFLYKSFSKLSILCFYYRLLTPTTSRVRDITASSGGIYDISTILTIVISIAAVLCIAILIRMVMFQRREKFKNKDLNNSYMFLVFDQDENVIS